MSEYFEENLEIKIGPLLKQLGLTLSTAESCTGGEVGHLITNVAGCSEYYLGGVISYDNRIKQQLLSVPAKVLENTGAVSSDCALAMARGARKLLGTNLALSTTGIAGPGGATPGKPVGLVYIGLVDDKGFEESRKFNWKYDRIGNKEFSARAALELLFEYLNKRLT